ncbi:MAG: MiaB/RimO family radical SAM methylthiotransferase [Deltaproteobacteria bacterium]|nr:MiaB/RimO family radical SAM methylthiotransferase [Deltaproteobacteria bacterium]
MDKIKVYVHTVGCRANQADSSVLEAHLDPALATIGGEDDADVFVVNTCCVTTEAERDCKKTARRLLRQNPNGKLLFTGCAVSAFSEFAKAFDDRVLSVGGGATSPVELAGWLNRFAKENSNTEVLPSTKSRVYDYFASGDAAVFQSVANVQGRTRALLKIQNGCTHNCSYCIVPKARGPEQSMPKEMVLRQVTAMKESGARELVFTGVQIGVWGKDLPGQPSIANLLDEAATLFAPGRIRLSSIEPWSVDEALIDVMAANGRICRHLHMPLQAGDDRVLDDMCRGYTATEWLQKVQMAKAKIPQIAVGTDVICGFPTEDDGAFENTLKVIEISKVAYVHGFSYSRRPGTIAAKTWGENRTIAKERVRRLRLLGDTLHDAYRASMVGNTCEVLVEEARRGITDTFLQVSFQQAMTPGDLVDVELYRRVDAPDSLCAKAIQYDKSPFLERI